MVVFCVLYVYQCQCGHLIISNAASVSVSFVYIYVWHLVIVIGVLMRLVFLLISKSATMRASVNARANICTRYMNQLESGVKDSSRCVESSEVFPIPTSSFSFIIIIISRILATLVESPKALSKICRSCSCTQ